MIENLVDHWIREAGHNIFVIMNEFGNLNDNQLRYTSHIRRCSILEIMMNLTDLNERFISHLESASSFNRNIWKTKGFGNYLSRFIIRYAMGFKCKKRHRIHPDLREVFLILSAQQGKLMQIIGNYSGSLLNGKVISFTLYGIIKIRLAVYIECMLECQSEHIVLARRQLMLL